MIITKWRKTKKKTVADENVPKLTGAVLKYGGNELKMWVIAVFTMTLALNRHNLC